MIQFINNIFQNSHKNVNFQFSIVPQMLSLCSSMFSMAWCIASYHRCIRLTQLDKINISWIGSIVQSSWHLTITGTMRKKFSEIYIQILSN